MLKLHLSARLALAATGGFALGCSSATGALAEPPEYNPENQTKCMVAKSQNKPLLVEWPAADRAELEGNMKRGLVAVRYEGCEMEVLSRCLTQGGYRYVGLSPKRDELVIKNEDELYAKLPLGAVSLAGELSKTGELRLITTIVGRYDAARLKVYRDELEGACEEATHVVYGLSVGAFRLSAGSTVTAGGGVTAQDVEVGGKGTSSKEVLRADGDEEACGLSEDSSDAPERCASLIRVEVMPIEDARPGAPKAQATAAGGTGGDTSPNETAQQVYADYLSMSWEPFAAKWMLPRPLFEQIMASIGEGDVDNRFKKYLADSKEDQIEDQATVSGPPKIEATTGKHQSGFQLIKVELSYPTKDGDRKWGKVELIRMGGRLYIMEVY